MPARVKSATVHGGLTLRKPRRPAAPRPTEQKKRRQQNGFGQLFHPRLRGRRPAVRLGDNATGIGGGDFEALVPIGTDVSEGDSLILPSISPKVFGVVLKVEELSEEGFKKISFELPVNPDEISSVGIVTHS